MNTDDRIKTIKNIAARFRRAIVSLDRNSLPITLQDYPRGACGDATLLLGTYLSERGFGSFDYVLGQRGDKARNNSDWTSHAWLEQDGLVVDITPDQLPDTNEEVIVTIRSPLHRQFNGEPQHTADYRLYDARTVAMLEPVYQKVVREMAKTSALQ